MAISFDSALGVHPQALNFRVQRTKVLASNLANVDTPGYLAKDLSFTTVMKQANPKWCAYANTKIGHCDAILSALPKQ